MNTLGLIITNIARPDIDFFSADYKNDGANGSVRIYFSILLASLDLSIKHQYKFFKESLVGFLMKGNEEIFIDYFCRIKKTYNVLNRFVYNYKYRRAKIVSDQDLCLNQLNPSDPNVICILQANAKYLFHINDMIKIMNTSLTNAFMFFSEPSPIKNPYNNLPFNKSTLYNIYYFIKFKTMLYPELVIKFYNSNFNLTDFKYKNEYLLREYIIDNFVYKSSQDVIADEIDGMIDKYNLYCKIKKLKNKIKIDDEFPTNTLVKIFQPYLLLYIRSKYAFLDHVKDYNAYALRVGLLKFNKFNPLFGRKTYRIQYRDTPDFKRKICGRVPVFNDRHVQFIDTDKSLDDFLNDHLTCRARGFIMDEPANIAGYLLYVRNGDDIMIDTDEDDRIIDTDEYDDIGSNINNVYPGNEAELHYDDDADDASDATDVIEDIYNTNNNLNMDNINYDNDNDNHDDDHDDDHDDEYEDESVS